MMFRSKLLALMVCAAGLFALQACTSKKEIPQPVVDTQRLDQLRQELRDLQKKVFGDAAKYSQDSLTYSQLLTLIKELEAQFNKYVKYSVIVSDYQGNSLPGVTVKVSQTGKVVSQTTSAAGTATFADLNGGIITATAELTGFARLVFKADIRNYDSDQPYSATSNILMLPMGGTTLSDAGMYTVNINLFANYTTVDDTLGGPAYWPAESTFSKALPVGPDPNNPTVSYSAITDKPIIAYLNSNFLGTAAPPAGFTYHLQSRSSIYGDKYDPGSVLTVAYENVTYSAAAAGPNGVYTLKLPATSFDQNQNTRFRFDLVFTEFSNSFTRYVPGGTIKIKGPFDPTNTSTQVFRVDRAQLQSNRVGNLESRKYFYFNSLN